MKFQILLCFLVVFSNRLRSQTTNSYLPHLQKAASATSYPQDYIDYVITNSHTSKRSNVTHYYINQRYGSIEIKNAVIGIHVTQDGLLVALDNQFNIDLKNIIGDQQPVISQLDAIKAVAQKMAYDLSDLPVILETKNDISQEVIFTTGSISQENIPVKLKYQPLFDGSIRLCWDLSILEVNSPDWWSFRIDAVTGQVLDQENWTLTCNFGDTHDNFHNCGSDHHSPSIVLPKSGFNRPSVMPSAYNVFPIGTESPGHGPRVIVTDPHDLSASPFGWHDTNGVIGAEYDYTKGNNVEAKDDIAGDNEGTIGQFANGGANLNFDFPLNFGLNPSQNLGAALTNLFYWNNIMHDVWYNYGFDEAAGNFQENNYGNGGNANDFVRADGLDGGGTNNANFSTPTDGSKPRMQMYLWNAPSSTLSVTVNSPAVIAGSYSGVKASFGPSAYNIIGDLVLADPILGCSALTNAGAINGKIAVIDRGTCQFGDKCLNAQNAGAIAVIVCNNVSSAPISMGSGNNGSSVTIPCIMISQSNCNTIKLQIANTVNVSLVGTGGIQLDGDFDNGIVAHEYGHGISTRLTGGAGNSSCLNNDEQMGEGWSDWFGLMLTIKSGDTGNQGRGIGTYALGQSISGTGIRQYKYSTDMAVNPHTYNNIQTVAIPHGVGSVWCAMLWEMSWLLIDAYGFDPDYYHGSGGNNIAMALVIEALKLQPCNPGFIDGRNAILQADNILYGGIHHCLIWKAFAKRGLGFSASQGMSTSRSDGTQAFDMSPDCCNQVFVKDNSGVGSLRDAINCSVNGDTILFAPFLNNKLIQLVGGITVGKNLFLKCNNSDGIKIGTDGSATTMIISANTNVELENVTITGGTNTIARVLLNNGSLVCRNVKIVDALFTSTTNGSIVNNGTINMEGNCSLQATP